MRDAFHTSGAQDMSLSQEKKKKSSPQNYTRKVNECSKNFGFKNIFKNFYEKEKKNFLLTFFYTSHKVILNFFLKIIY